MSQSASVLEILQDSGWGTVSAPNGERVKGTNPALKKPSNIPEIYAKMFGRIH